MNKLTVAEIRKSVEILKKNERKPVWRLTWKFPFIRKFYILYPEDLKVGKTIDYFVKRELKK